MKGAPATWQGGEERQGYGRCLTDGRAVMPFRIRSEPCCRNLLIIYKAEHPDVTLPPPPRARDWSLQAASPPWTGLFIGPGLFRWVVQTIPGSFVRWLSCA